MHIIKQMKDIRTLGDQGQISKKLHDHLIRKVERLQKILEPDQSAEEFDFTLHGPIGIMEEGDRDLSSIGLPQNLAHIMPEWISQLETGGEKYYVLYVMADNDCVVQVYLPDHIMADKVRLWLSEQPLEEEEDTEDEDAMPEPF